MNPRYKCAKVTISELLSKICNMDREVETFTPDSEQWSSNKANIFCVQSKLIDTIHKGNKQGLQFITHSTLPFYRQSLSCHQILKSKSLGLLNLYQHEVEDDLEINLFPSFPFRDVFRFEIQRFEFPNSHLA